MRLSGLAVAVLLLVSPVLFAQHSSGGGASSGGASSGGSSGGFSGGGGSHGGYSGGSGSGSYASSGHSSGGSASSSSHRFGGSASRSSTRSTGQSQIQNGRVQGYNRAERMRKPEPDLIGFFAFLRHPFRKHAPKPAEARLRRPLRCPPDEYWNGLGCTSASLFRPNDCSNLALALDRQERQSQLAESSRQASCSSDAAAQECSQLTARYQDESARYNSLLQQYQQCRRQSLLGLPDRLAIR
jgi:hypothetical protein